MSFSQRQFLFDQSAVEWSCAVSIQLTNNSLGNCSQLLLSRWWCLHLHCCPKWWTQLSRDLSPRRPGSGRRQLTRWLPYFEVATFFSKLAISASMVWNFLSVLVVRKISFERLSAELISKYSHFLLAKRDRWYRMPMLLYGREVKNNFNGHPVPGYFP